MSISNKVNQSLDEIIKRNKISRKKFSSKFSSGKKFKTDLKNGKTKLQSGRVTKAKNRPKRFKRPIKSEKSTKNGKASATSGPFRLTVSNLNSDVSLEDMSELFSDYGMLQSVSLNSEKSDEKSLVYNIYLDRIFHLK